MRTYERTHAWITFQIDLTRPAWELWLLAGEVMSKCEHLQGTALRPDAAAQLMQVYLAQGAQATTAIEGNTLSEQQVLHRLEGTLQLPPSKEYLGVEVDNIIAASNTILNDYLRDALPPLTPDLICGFNRQVLQGLAMEEQIVAGELRTYSVGVADYRGAPAEDVPHLLTELCRWLAVPWLTHLQPLRDQDRTHLEAILKAVVVHLYLAWIHPCGDGNGRTARLVEFYMLVKAGIPFPAAHLLSNHYNETRAEYYRQLSYASKSGGDVLKFCTYALRGFADQLREQITRIRDQQWTLFWQNHVHQTLGDTETGRRRCYLVLDLAKSPEPVEVKKMTEVSVRVLKHYMNKHEKTLLRDLLELENLGLVQRVGDRYRANVEIVRAYLPPSRGPHATHESPAKPSV
jgi:Fic family protein